MILDFVRGIFGKSKREELYKLSDEEMGTIKNLVERRLEEEKMERIIRTMTTDSTKSKDTGFWTVTVEYKEQRFDDDGESETTSIGAKSISKNLDSAITDGWFTISTMLAPFGGDLFKLKESKES